MSNQRIGVIQGGQFPGREQSLNVGGRVADALRHGGHPVLQFDVDGIAVLIAELQETPIEVAILTLARGPERDAVVSALELLGIAHTGSSLLSNSLSSDRLKARELLRLHNLPTCPHYVVDSNEAKTLKDVHGSFGYPVWVSPRRSRDELSPSLVSDFEGLQQAVEAALEVDDQLVVERAVEGTIVEAALLNGRMLGALQRTEAGWQTPKLEPTRLLGVVHLAERATRALECRGAVRVCALVTQSGNEYILDVDAAPSLGEGSILPEVAARAGFDFGQLCGALVQGAIAGQGQGVRRATPRVSSAPQHVRPATELEPESQPRLSIPPLKVAV